MNLKDRNSNFELMRIISMLFIIFWHIYIFGGIRYNPRIVNDSIKEIFDFITFILVVHVNSFVLLNGYFQHNLKFNLKKVFKLINQTLFYKIVIVIPLLFAGLIMISKVDLFKYFFPLNLTTDINYWYIRIFIFLYIISPFLNLFIEKMNKKEHRRVLIILFFIFSVFPFISGNQIFENSGYSLCNFIYLYLIGSYLKKYPFNFKNISKSLYQIILVSLFILCCILNYSIFKTSSILMNVNTFFNEIFGNIYNMHHSYSNPITIIQTIIYFLFFETLNFKSKRVNKIASLTLGIYLIHNNRYLSGLLYRWLKIDNGLVQHYRFILYVFICGLFIFIVSAIIEWIRQILFRFISNRKCIKKVNEKLYNYIDSIGFID